LAFFGVRLLWAGFPFLAASVYGGSIPGHVLGTLMGLWPWLAWSLFVAGHGRDFALLFGFWLFICGPGW
jgi:hypothetical protein